MKHSFLLCTAISLLPFACKEQDSSTKALSPTRIEFQEFTLLPGQMDTVLHTNGGARVFPNISESEFDITSPITLSIREFLTLENMILGGLPTVGEEGLMQSQGMYYLEAHQNGEKIDFQTPWKIEVPVEFIEQGFESFVADGGSDDPGIWRKANRQDPVDSLVGTLAKGDSFYHAFCPACHSIKRKLIGPQLGGAAEKFDWDWLVKFTRNAPGMIVGGDSLALCIWLDSNRGAMSDFLHLDETEVKNIYFYIENERRRNNYPKSLPGLCQGNLNEALQILTKKVRVNDSIARTRPPVRIRPGGRIIPSLFYYPFLASSGWTNCDRYLLGDLEAKPIANIKISGVIPPDEAPVSLSEVVLISRTKTVQRFSLLNSNEGFQNDNGATIWILETEPQLIAVLQERADGLVGIYFGEHILKEYMDLTVPLSLIPEGELEAFIAQKVNEFTL